LCIIFGFEVCANSSADYSGHRIQSNAVVIFCLGMEYTVKVGAVGFRYGLQSQNLVLSLENFKCIIKIKCVRLGGFSVNG